MPPSDRPTLLVAIDFASDAESICLKAASLSRRLGAHCVLVHVVQLPVGLKADERVKHPGTGEPVTALDLLLGDAEKHTEPLLDLMRMHGADCDVEIRRGRIVDEIAAAADVHAPLMVVMGCDLPTGLRRLFQGSVTEAIIHAVDVPVLVVKGDPDAERIMSTGQMQAASENDG